MLRMPVKMQRVGRTRPRPGFVSLKGSLTFYQLSLGLLTL